MLRFELLKEISDIDKLAWNCLCGSDYPFLYWEFLYALESSGSVCAEKGWQAKHVLVYEDAELLAVMPMYLKGHSQGEYVFDQSWAHAYGKHGLSYYPKFLTAIPFTPCQGPRICFSEKIQDFGLTEHLVFLFILENLKFLAKKYQVSSWHCLFPEQDALKNLSEEDVLIREGVQFQWFNNSYENFDSFLEGFTSKRRKNLKRERRLVKEQGIRIFQLRGQEISREHWSVFFQFYQSTYWKRGMPEYLNIDFFHLLADLMPQNLLMVVAERDERMIAAALSIIGEDTLYGRYWGCLQDYDNLHFELCYYQGIEFCIEHGLKCFNSGAQGEHKIARGFEPVTTYSLHWIAHSGFRQAIADFLVQENEYMHRYQDAAGELLPFNINYPVMKNGSNED